MLQNISNSLYLIILLVNNWKKYIEIETVGVICREGGDLKK